VPRLKNYQNCHNSNFSQNLVHFSKKSFITGLFETFCITTPYDKRKLINRAITWRWADRSKLYRLAARGRQNWLNISGTSQVRGLKFVPQTHLVGCLFLSHTIWKKILRTNLRQKWISIWRHSDVIGFAKLRHRDVKHALLAPWSRHLFLNYRVFQFKKCLKKVVS